MRVIRSVCSVSLRGSRRSVAHAPQAMGSASETPIDISLLSEQRPAAPRMALLFGCVARRFSTPVRSRNVLQ